MPLQYAQYEKPCTISMSTWPLRGDNFSRFLTDKRWFPVSKVPNYILGRAACRQLLMVRKIIAILPYHIFELLALFLNLCMASHNMLVAPNNDSVSTVWALVTTHRRWFGQDMFKRDGNSVKGLQLFLRLFSGDGCSRVYGKS